MSPVTAKTSVTTVASVASVATLVGDPTRAEMLAVLLDGRAHTVGELARHAGVAVSTASGHLGRLLDGGLVAVEAQGRHRYHRLAGPEVASLLEQLHALAAQPPAPVRAPAALAYARTCYDHLAGTVAVALYDRLVDTGALHLGDAGPELAPAGAGILARLGVDTGAVAATEARGRRPLTRACLDWTERRPHLAGALGAALLDSLVAARWVVRQPSSRAVRVTDAGREGLTEALGGNGFRARSRRSPAPPPSAPPPPRTA